VNAEMADRPGVTVPRRTLATTDRYADAEAIVDRLADEGFPVQHVSIVGRDLQYVERMTGHLNAWKAAGGGALSGLVLGLLVGLLFGAWFAHDGTSLLAIIIYWAIFGAVIGAALALFGFAMTGGRRNFASVAGLQAQRFDVLVDEPYAEEALRILATGRRQTHPIS
jgi:hypothetical protein